MTGFATAFRNRCSRVGVWLTLAFAFASPASGQQSRSVRGPIIDVHMHGGPARSSSHYSNDGEFLQYTLAEMERFGVVLALTSVRHAERYAERWRTADPERLVVGPQLTWDTPWPDTVLARREYAAGRFGVMGEVGYVYLGLPPTDARVEALFALAHEFDVPVAAHIGRRRAEARPPGCCPDFNDDYGDPALLRPILDRYPGLGLYLLHVGGVDSYFENAIALMRDYPNVYADMSVIAMRAPREVFYANLRRLMREGLLERIMFGSDGPEFIAPHVEAFEAIPFLTEQQRRGIFYENAARFLRLSPEQMELHRARTK